jgi:hypothetical protein
MRKDKRYEQALTSCDGRSPHKLQKETVDAFFLFINDPP